MRTKHRHLPAINIFKADKSIFYARCEPERRECDTLVGDYLLPVISAIFIQKLRYTYNQERRCQRAQDKQQPLKGGQGCGNMLVPCCGLSSIPANSINSPG